MNTAQLTEEGREFLDEWCNAEPYVVAHTSGSTGAPKEIHLLKTDMLESARSTNVFFGIDCDSLLVSPLSPQYIAGKMMIVRALAADCSLIMEEPSNQPIQSHYGTVKLLPIVPSQVDGLLESPYVADIENVIIGGAPLTDTQEQKILTSAPFRAYATFGMTETCSHVALRPVGKNEYAALPGISFRTVDDDRLEIVAESRSFGSLVTNDIVELTDEQHFRWIGRADNVVISGGVKLHPEAIEQKIATMMPLPFFIAGEPDEKWGERLILVVERNYENHRPEAGGLDMMIAQVISKIVNKTLDKYEIPKRLYFVNSIPRTTNGKIIRKIHR